MLRLDRQRLASATFPERKEFPVRFDDIDVQSHVNNVATAVLLQEARVTFHRSRIRDFMADGRAIVVGSLFVDYAGPMHYPHPVEIATGVLEIGRVSYVLGHIIGQQGRMAVFAEATLVFTENGRAAEISDAMRAVLGAATIVPA
jgi:acyl-CoA thioester hydrolase